MKKLDGKSAIATGFGRGRTPEQSAGALYLMCIPESDYISGELVLASGGFVM